MESYSFSEIPEELLGELKAQTRPLAFQGGQNLNAGKTAQGGGAIIGGGIGKPPSSGWAGFWQFRGFVGGKGTR